MIRQTSTFMFGRIAAAAVAAASVPIFTRLLSPAEYGVYASVNAAAIITSMIGFGWLRNGLIRFTSAEPDSGGPLLSTCAIALLIAGALALAGIVAAGPLLPGEEWAALTLGAAVFLSFSGFDLATAALAARHMPGRHSLGSILRSVAVLPLACGAYVLLGGGSTAPLAGTALGNLVAVGFLCVPFRREIRLRDASLHLANRMLTFGWPTVVSSALGFITGTGDRLLLAAMAGAGAAGVYAVSYDLPRQTVFVLISSMNLGTYPIVLKRFDEEGPEAARQQLATNLVMLLSLGLPATVGLTFLAGDVCRVMVGESFRDSAASLLPWIAVATLMQCLRTYYFDQAFELVRRPTPQAVISTGAAAASLALNLTLIPLFGAAGAAYTAVTVFAGALVVSALWSRRAFRISLPLVDIGKIGAACVAMVLALTPLRGWMLGAGAGSFIGLATEVAVGGAVYAAAALALDVKGLRPYLLSAVRRRLSLIWPGARSSTRLGR